MSAANRKTLAKTVANSNSIVATKRKEKTVSSRDDKLLSQLVSPGNGALTRTPVLHSSLGATRHFTRTLEVSPTAAGDYFAVKVTPEISDFLEIQAGTVNVAAASISGNITRRGNDVTYHMYPTATGDPMARGVLAPRDDTNTNYDLYWASTKTGQLNTIQLVNTGRTTGLYTFRVWHNAGFTDYTGVLGPGLSVGLAASCSAGVNTWTGCGIRFNDIMNHKLDFDLSFIDTSSVSFNMNEHIRPLVRDEYLDMGQVLQYRVSAMSILATYTGNFLENAGVIAAARKPRTWSPASPHVYNAIASLPEEAYDGPLIKGAYAWWLPLCDEEIDFRRTPLEDSSCLYVAGRFTDLGGSLRIRIDVVVDFYAVPQFFEKLPYPVFDDSIRRLYHELQYLPAATCNPSHEDLKRIFMKGKALVKQGIEFGKQHPELVNAGLKALASLAL